jgi:hypothetical protein
MKRNPKKKKTDFRVLLPVCIVLPLLAILAGALLFNYISGGPSSTGEAYLEEMTACHAEGILELYHPKMITYLQTHNGDRASEIASRLQSRLDGWYDTNFSSCGENITFAYDLTDKQSLDEETLAELKEIIGDGVSDAVVYQGEITATGSAGSKTVTHWVQLVKVDGVWYLYNLQMLL